MMRTIARFSLPLLLCLGVQAATTNTTLTVKATTAIGAGGITANGTADLGSAIGSGTFTSTLDVTTLKASFKIALSGGDLTGTLTLPQSVLTGSTSGSGSATISGGTGSYNGATGSFPSLTGTFSGSFPSLSITFSGAGSITTGGTTGGGGGTSTTPAITDVLDAASYSKNVAQGSIFVVKGTNLSASGFKQYGFPLPTVTSADNVKITFTPAAGGTGTDAYLVYLYNQGGVNQLAGILPSSVAAGNYNVTVTNGSSSSAPFAATVVQRKIGIITQDSTGSGLAVVQNYVSASQLDVDRFTTGTISGTTISPAKPGQVLIAWATGMGSVTGGDNTASPGYDFTKNGVNVQVIVGGTTIAPLYAGRAPGLAGADQINFQLPSNIPTGCAVSLQVSVNGAVSNSTFISIAPDANSGACVMQGFTSQQLQDFDNGKSYTVGAFDLSTIGETVPQLGAFKISSIGGSFVKITGFQLATAAQYNYTTQGACQIYHTSGTIQSGQTQTPSPTPTPTGSATLLDAGAVTLTGPSGSGITNLALTNTSNAYSASLSSIPGLPSGTNYNLVAGTYMVNGAGGKDVGAFNASINLGNPLIVNGGVLPTSIVRASGLPLTWTGGNASDLVEIVGVAETTSTSGTTTTFDEAEFICTTTAGQGSFTVPASILNQFPAVAAGALGSTGFLEVVSSVTPASFSAPLVAGGNIDAGYFLALQGLGGTVAFQ